MDPYAGDTARSLFGSAVERAAVRLCHRPAADRPEDADGDRDEGGHPDGDHDEGSHPDGERDEGGHPDGDRDAGGHPDGDRERTDGRDDDARTLASRVDVADSHLARARGLMFRRSVPADYALAFPFDAPGVRWLHMLFVPFDIDAVWTVDGRVRRVERLAAWTGLARAEADLVYELPAGAAADVTRGDRVELREG